ncbi:hypothetical protein OK016_01150 [Vibrio chagasii]|nr:hypothetical protein [Vibrio chagasii]
MRSVPWLTKDAFTLDEVITMNGLVDTDGFEELFVRNFSNITEGAVLPITQGMNVVPTVTINGNDYCKRNTLQRI